jgi:chromosome segregation ATPase
LAQNLIVNSLAFKNKYLTDTIIDAESEISAFSNQLEEMRNLLFSRDETIQELEQQIGDLNEQIEKMHQDHAKQIQGLKESHQTELANLREDFNKFNSLVEEEFKVKNTIIKKSQIKIEELTNLIQKVNN